MTALRTANDSRDYVSPMGDLLLWVTADSAPSTNSISTVAFYVSEQLTSVIGPRTSPPYSSQAASIIGPGTYVNRGTVGARVAFLRATGDAQEIILKQAITWNFTLMGFSSVP